MAQARCRNGHIYDPEIYGNSCPYCDPGIRSIQFGDESSIDFGNPEPFGVSRVEGTLRPETIQKTVPPKAFRERQDQIRETVGVYAKHHGHDPVVGWLVCVKGHDQGESFQIRARTNSIGRGGEMDIRVRGDDTVSSDTHAKIDYDILNNDFYLLPANNRNTIYVNRTPLYSPHRLEAYDRIRLGESEFLFVPFCCDRFTWDQEEQGEKA
ncbi:MAG: FHA domain-containing protein [Oscillospiraceae bacterium]|nr:FHA domain-containing protein [Oscillospiraceae bacterium]